jgi:hypothetical protein
MGEGPPMIAVSRGVSMREEVLCYEAVPQVGSLLLRWVGREGRWRGARGCLGRLSSARCTIRPSAPNREREEDISLGSCGGRRRGGGRGRGHAGQRWRER